MKRFLLMTAALLCFVGLSGQNRKNGLPFKTDPQKGLYIGIAPVEDLLTGQQKSLVMALTAFAVDVPVDNTDNYFSSGRTFNCDIRVVDIKFVDDLVYTLFKISLEGDYKVMVSSKGRSVQDGDTFMEATENLISLSLENQSNGRSLEWKWRDSYSRDGTTQQIAVAGTVYEQYEESVSQQ